MHKYLLLLTLVTSLLLTLIFPFSKTHAEDPKCTETTESSCPDGSRPGAGGCAGGSGGAPALPTSKKVWTCSGTPGTTPSQQDASCVCKAGSTTGGAGGGTTPVTGTGITTGGSGLSCNIVSGALENGSGIMTAIGCIPTQPQKLVEGLLWYGTLASGGVAFILMLLAAITMITAEGNPNTIKTAQERFYSAIIGLLIIIFSVLLMQVIGVDILGLQGFGK